MAWVEVLLGKIKQCGEICDNTGEQYNTPQLIVLAGLLMKYKYLKKISTGKHCQL